MQQGSVLGSFLPFLIFFAIIYFIVIKPQQKQAKEHKAMVDALSKGDKIITSGGLKAVVVKTNDDFITIKLNDDTQVELSKDYVLKKLDA